MEADAQGHVGSDENGGIFLRYYLEYDDHTSETTLERAVSGQSLPHYIIPGLQGRAMYEGYVFLWSNQD